MSEPQSVPGLADVVDGPDAETRRRLAASVASLVAGDRLETARRLRWTRIAAVALAVGVLAAIVLVPLLRERPAVGPRPTATTTGPTGTTLPPTTTSSPVPPGGTSAPFAAGSRVPSADLLAVSFWSDAGGAGLAAPPTVPWQSQVVVTSDGGRTWHAVSGVLPQGGPNWSSIAWAANGHGFVWSGSAILRTVDGGRHWQRLPAPTPTLAPATLGSVSVDGDDLWADFDCSANCLAPAAQPGSSVWKWTGRAWRVVLAPSQVAGGHVSEVLRLPGLDLVLAGSAAQLDARLQGKAGEPTGSLLVSRDGGATWSSLPLPCGQIIGRDGNAPQQPFEVTTYPDSVATVSGVPGTAAALVCSGSSFMHLQPASLWTLSALATGGTWHLRADDLRVAGLLYPHVPADVGAAGWGVGSSLVESLEPGVIWMDHGRGGPARSIDSGTVWRVVPTVDPPLGLLSQLQFVDALHGWCLFADQAAAGLYRTSDGGASWERLG